MRKKAGRLLLPAGAAALILASGLSLVTGRYSLSMRDIALIIAGSCEDSMKTAVFLDIRLPRVMLSALSGAALALAGWVYQSVLMNSLASPDVLGVGSGCAIGAAAGILMGMENGAIQFFSLAMGLITVALTMLLARAIGRDRSVTMLLSGIAVGALANSAIMLMKYTADPERQLPTIEYWLMGSFHSASWNGIFSVLPWLIPCAAMIILLRHPVRLISLGDEEARALGVPATAVRYVSLAAATGLVAATVSVVGAVSWIGLIVPHLCRIVSGEHRRTPAEVILWGAALLTSADLAARSLTSGEIPISILTSFMGAVFLGAVLIMRRRRAGRDAS